MAPAIRLLDPRLPPARHDGPGPVPATCFGPATALDPDVGSRFGRRSCRCASGRLLHVPAQAARARTPAPVAAAVDPDALRWPDDPRPGPGLATTLVPARPAATATPAPTRTPALPAVATLIHRRTTAGTLSISHPTPEGTAK